VIAAARLRKGNAQFRIGRATASFSGRGLLHRHGVRVVVPQLKGVERVERFGLDARWVSRLPPGSQ
jgi:hypothetical protein